MNKCLNFDYSEKYYRLWWEYLRRNKFYKEFCLWMRKKKECPDIKIPEKFVINRGKKQWHRVVYTYTMNYDIHAFSFEEWYKYKKNCFSMMQKSTEKSAIKSYNDFVKSDIKTAISFLQSVLKRDPTLDELQEYYNNDFSNEPYYTSRYVIDPFLVDSNTMIKLIQHEIKQSKARKQPIRYDELERYLMVYDLKKDGKSMKEIIKTIFSHDSDDKSKYKDADVLRGVRRDIAKAKKIIINTEKGIFPGQYS